MNHGEKLNSKPRTLKELSSAYSVNEKTFKSWIRCNTLKHIIPEKGYFYSINQITEIVNHLGEP